MGIFGAIKSALGSHFDKNNEQKQLEESIKAEAEIQRRQVFGEEYRKHLMEVAKLKAIKDAEQKSGILKLRALNRSMDLAEEKPNMMSKLSELTRKNIAKREENLARTAQMRAAGEQMKMERIQKIQQEREQKLSNNNFPRKSQGYIR